LLQGIWKFVHILPRNTLAGHFLALSEPSWVNCTERIRNRWGRELLGRGMFWRKKYFTNGAWRVKQETSICKKVRPYFRATEFADSGLADCTA
jgi:hypothetical protein